MSLGQSFRARTVGMGVYTPNFRASYEAEAMMPRFSPPTATGLPRRRGSAACSTEAKNASASRWMIVRGTFVSLRLADQGDHDALDDQFVRRDQLGITRVFGAKLS